jgi:hypothetical protein
VNRPLTHAQYAKDCAAAAAKHQRLRQFVQVEYGGAPVCGVIVDAWDTSEGHEMWKVDLIGVLSGRMSFPATKVRKCSGVDGRCHCHRN